MNTETVDFELKAGITRIRLKDNFKTGGGKIARFFNKGDEGVFQEIEEKFGHVFLIVEMKSPQGGKIVVNLLEVEIIA